MAKTLKECLKVIGIESADERMIQGISCDTRCCQKDWIFVAVQGAHHHGCEFVQDAKRRQAFVLCEGNAGDIRIEEAQKVLALLVNDFYQNPSDQMLVIGVTGTNGKTTTTSLLKEMFTALGKKCARIGTDHIEMMEEMREYDHTTPTFMENLHLFLEAVKSGVEVMIMEVSSHAIHESRIGFIRFDYMIYTNVTLEHLDYHLTFTHYRYTKFKARQYLKKDGWLLINYDRKELHEIFQLQTHHILTYGTSGHVQMKQIELYEEGSSFEVNNIRFETELIGLVNLYNALSCLALFQLMGIELSQLKEILKTCHGALGRMEVLKIQNKTVVIDYAHSIDALKTLLIFAQNIAKGNLITVIGCGGERDRTKRPIMAQLAAQYSRAAVFTEDNSRNENLDEILKDMGAELYPNVFVEKKRTKAIQLALALAQDDDMIVVAGKGNEHFIVAGNQKIPYNDKEYLKQLNKGDV